MIFVFRFSQQNFVSYAQKRAQYAFSRQEGVGWSHIHLAVLRGRRKWESGLACWPGQKSSSRYFYFFFLFLLRMLLHPLSLSLSLSCTPYSKFDSVNNWPLGFNINKIKLYLTLNDDVHLNLAENWSNLALLLQMSTVWLGKIPKIKLSRLKVQI